MLLPLVALSFALSQIVMFLSGVCVNHIFASASTAASSYLQLINCHIIIVHPLCCFVYFVCWYLLGTISEQFTSHNTQFQSMCLFSCNNNNGDDDNNIHPPQCHLMRCFPSLPLPFELYDWLWSDATCCTSVSARFTWHTHPIDSFFFSFFYLFYFSF